MVGSELDKIILIFDLNIKARSGQNFVSLFGNTGLTVQIESAHGLYYISNQEVFNITHRSVT